MTDPSEDLKRIEEKHGWRRTSELSPTVKLARALDEIMHELGVPQPGYPAPVANAYEAAERTLREVAGGEDA